MDGGQLNLLSSVVLKRVIAILMVIIQKKYFGYVFCPITVSKLLISVYFYVILKDNNCLSRKLKPSSSRVQISISIFVFPRIWDN